MNGESKLTQLIRLENHHRRLAQKYEGKADYHWNLANKYLLDIQGEAENEQGCSLNESEQNHSENKSELEQCECPSSGI